MLAQIYIITDVVLEFQSPTFSTTEGTAAEMCVVIQAGMIARPVAFSVTPSDGTATGIQNSSSALMMLITSQVLLKGISVHDFLFSFWPRLCTNFN